MCVLDERYEEPGKFSQEKYDVYVENERKENWSWVVLDLLQEKAALYAQANLDRPRLLIEVRPKQPQIDVPETTDEESVKSAPMKDCKELRNLRQQNQAILKLEHQFCDSMGKNTIADAIGLLKPEELRLLQQARKIRASIANMMEDVELQPETNSCSS